MPRIGESGSLVLPLDAAAWPPPRGTAIVEGVRLQPKAALHLTVFGRRLGSELRATLAPSYLEDALRHAWHPAAWRISRGGRLLLLRRMVPGDGGPVAVHSVIECVQVAGMAPFHHALGRLLGRQLPVPPPHVTLYAAGRESGIGVANMRQLRALTVRQVAPAQLPVHRHP